MYVVDTDRQTDRQVHGENELLTECGLVWSMVIRRRSDDEGAEGLYRVWRGNF